MVLTLGKELWGLYESISENIDNGKPQESGIHRNSNDPDKRTAWEYFERKEFNCPCCDQNRISTQLVDMLDKARGRSGVPFRVSSGFRCKTQNRRVSGKRRSSHLDGFAADLICPSGSIKATIVASLFSVGAKRVGIYPTFVHVDISPTLPSPMLWIG